MKIIVVYNRVKSTTSSDPNDILADEDTVITAKQVNEGLISLGYVSSLFEVDENNFPDLKNQNCDLFFNLMEGIGSLPKSSVAATALLEKLKKPFTGSGSRALSMTTDKVETKEALLSYGLPTAKFQLFTNGEPVRPDLKFPLIVKPVDEDCSLGIDFKAVVTNLDELYTQLNKVRNKYNDKVFAEEYIDGRELNVTVMGSSEKPQALPISEIVFGQSFNNKFKVVNFAAKWNLETEDYKETVGKCPAELPIGVENEVKWVAMEAYKITNCQDYARVDIRLDKSNKPFILEVNINPGIGVDDGAVRSARAAGMDYPHFLKRIVELSTERF